jgi:hypothetical protein
MTTAAWMLIACVVTLNNNDRLPVVPQCEINQCGTFTQMILWSHESTGGKFKPRVSQWWILECEPLITQRNGWYVVRSRGVEFRTRRLIQSKTDRDPEQDDRVELPEDQRTPFFDVLPR